MAARVGVSRIYALYQHFDRGQEERFKLGIETGTLQLACCLSGQHLCYLLLGRFEWCVMRAKQAQHADRIVFQADRHVELCKHHLAVQRGRWIVYYLWCRPLQTES